MSEQQTLPGELAAQISRVTKIRCQYEETGRLIGDMTGVRASIMMMTQSIDAAIKAAGSPDIEAQIRAVRDLKEYGSN